MTWMKTMRPQAGVIEGTAREVRADLARLQDDEIVKLMIGRPSLSITARKLWREAASRGMTGEIHDELIGSLKAD
jgi:hypothetical protein